MADGSVIKEFLASLGFQVDQEGLKRFERTMASVTAGALKLGAALTAVSLEVELAVRKVAEQFEDLYYASMRSGSTAQNLKNLGYAAEQIGVGSDAAKAAVTGLYHALILNPGTQGLLQNLGVQVRDLDTTKIADTSKLLVRLVEKLKEFGEPGTPGFAVAARYAEMFGITADQLVLLERQLPEFKQQMADSALRLHDAGINADDLAKKSHSLMVAVRRLGDELENIATQAISPLIEPMTKLVNSAERGAETFAKWSHSLRDIPSLLGGIVAAIGGAKVAGAIGRFLFGKGAAQAAEGAAGMSVPQMAGTAAAGGLSAYLRWLAPWAAGVTTLMHSTPLNEGEDAKMREYLRQHGYGAKVPLGIRSNNPLNMMPGGDEAVYENPMQGYVAGARNLIRYARHGWDTIESIVKHWAPAAAGNNVKAYVADLVQRLGVGAQTHLNLYDPQTLSRVMSAMTFHEQGYNPYSAALIGQASRYALGGTPYQPRAGAVTLNQKTEINVSGSKDPRATGHAVAGEQRRVNADAIRNLSSAVQ